MKNVLNNIVDWLREYDDEITWFLIGFLFAGGINVLKRDVPYGLFMLFISAVLWIIYIKELKDRK